MPVLNWTMPLGNIASETTGNQVATYRQAAMRFWNDVIKSRRPAKCFAAICTLMIPGQQYLVSGRSARDQFGLINVLVIH